MELSEEAVEDGVFMMIGFVRSGWFTPWFEGFRIFLMVGLAWTGCDGRV